LVLAGTGDILVLDDIGRVSKIGSPSTALIKAAERIGVKLGDLNLQELSGMLQRLLENTRRTLTPALKKDQREIFQHHPAGATRHGLCPHGR
jgi:hypothetical protein